MQLKELMSKVRLGDPSERSVFQGYVMHVYSRVMANELWISSPQVDLKQLAHIQRLVDAGKQDGALVFGGSRHGKTVRQIQSWEGDKWRLIKTRELLWSRQSS